MAAISPIKATYTGSDPTGLAEFISSDFIAIADGGTGATTDSDARVNLGLEIGVDIQAYDDQLTDISNLTPTDGHVIIGDGTNFITENGETLRTSIGLGSNDDVTFANLILNGNLTVSGTTTSVNTETINLADNIITLNSNATGSASENGGIEIQRGDDTNVLFIWDEFTNKWSIGSETFVAGTVESNLIGNVSGGTVSSLTSAIAIADGGTGATTDSDARVNLGLEIGVDIQAYASQLTDISGLTPTDSSFIVGDGTNFVLESGATVRTSLDVYSTAEALATANNLSDLSDLPTARSNLGVYSTTESLATANNLSDLSDLQTARSNLGVSSTEDVTNLATNSGIIFSIALG